MKYDVVVIGGSAAGLISAKTAKLSYPEKSVLVIRKEEISLVPCGIPYGFSTLKSIDDDIMGIDPIKKLGVDFLIEEVTKVDIKSKKVFTSNNEVEYDKLIFATGSTPFIPPIEGKDLDGVYTIPKDYYYLKDAIDKIKKAKDIVVIGAGFIGIEVSDELRKEVDNVTLVEALDCVLPLAFDRDIAEEIAAKLRENGLNIMISKRVKRIVGENGKVSAVEFEDGEVIKADAVILSIGYKPNTKLAADAGLLIGKNGAIWVDEYLRTSEKDVYAAGDCAEHKDFFTRRSTKLMLASTATFDARVAGENLFTLKVVRESKGNISIFSSAIEGLAMGAAGVTEHTAIKEGFEIVIGKFSTIDRHPGTLPDKTKTVVKLIFAKYSGVLLGAQIIGGKSVGEMINILGLAIQKTMTATELATLQFGTHPLLTAAPTMYPIVSAAESALRQICTKS